MIRERVLKALEDRREKKEIGNSLEAEVELALSDPDEASVLGRFSGPELAALLLVSRASVRQGPGEAGVAVRRARGRKCERCWNWREDTGVDPGHPDVCGRCSQVLKGA